MSEFQRERSSVIILRLQMVVTSLILEGSSGNAIYQSVCVFACRKLEGAVYRLVITNVFLASLAYPCLFRYYIKAISGLHFMEDSTSV
jgi:hypothetical protein